jgi:hypothetical protein
MNKGGRKRAGVRALCNGWMGTFLSRLTRTWFKPFYSRKKEISTIDQEDHRDQSNKDSPKVVEEHDKEFLKKYDEDSPKVKEDDKEPLKKSDEDLTAALSSVSSLWSMDGYTLTSESS